MTSFMLAGALTMANPNAYVLPDKDAVRYITKAVFIETGLNKTVSDWEKKNLKLDQRPELAYIGIIGRIAVEQRITYRWEF